jgi:DNA-binding transcriptional LysR family regulator
MTLKQLEVFLAVADTRSFSKGGEAVSLAQSTASQHIRALEDELGVRLFDRSATLVRLTEVGRLFYDHAERICRQCVESVDAVRRFQGLEQATLRIGASTIPAVCLIPDMLGHFTSAWPGVRLQLQQGDTREVLRLLQDELVELAVVGGRSDDDSICFEKVQTEQIVLVSRPDQIDEPFLSMQRLSEVPLVLREPGSGTRQATETALRLAGLDPRSLRVVAQLGSSEAVRRAVLGGAGYGFISSLAVGHELQEGRLVAISVEGLEILQPFYLTTRRGSSLSPAAEAFKVLLGVCRT